MKIQCKLGTNKTITIEVSPNDPLYLLLTKLNLSDTKTKFIFRGETYCLARNLTFMDIGMTSDSIIYINNQAISGGGVDENNRFAN